LLSGEPFESTPSDSTDRTAETEKQGDGVSVVLHALKLSDEGGFGGEQVKTDAVAKEGLIPIPQKESETVTPANAGSRPKRPGLEVNAADAAGKARTDSNYWTSPTFARPQFGQPTMPVPTAVLHRAAMWGFDALTEWLIAQTPGNVQALDDERRTALHWLALGKNPVQVELPPLDDGVSRLWPVEFLSDFGRTARLLLPTAQLDERDARGLAALHYAAATGKVEVVDEMLQAGVDPDLDDANQGSTALHYVASEGHWRVAAQLIAAAADVNWENDFLRTPLAYAAREGNTEVCDLLITSRANLTPADENQMIPLHLAAREGHSVTCALFLSSARAGSVEPMADAADEYARTPLHHAVWKGNLRVVDVLLEYRCDVNCQDDYGATALHYAAFRGNFTACEKLLAMGAEQVQDKEEHTPLHVARRLGWDEVEGLLGGGEWLLTIGPAPGLGRSLTGSRGSRFICCSGRNRTSTGSRAVETGCEQTSCAIS
jgi:ankyrin repeat protein